MRVLFVSHWFPYPPNNGSRIRIYNLIKALARSHDVFLLSLLQQDSLAADAANLSDICTVVSLHPAKEFNPGALRSLLGLFSTRPRSVVDTYDLAVKSAVQRAVQQIKPDVIVVSTLGVVEYVLDHLKIPSVLIDHNCEFALLKRNTEFHSSAIKRWRYELGWRKFARWEAAICRQFSAVVMPSEEDKQQMLDYAPDLTHIHVIPNGADAGRFEPARWSPNKNSLMYNGALTYSANLDAVNYYASEIYPQLKLKFPQLKLLVTGRNKDVNLGSIDQCPGIELTGYVDDIRDVLYQSVACVVPLRQGGGMRLKIPEAMAAGVPVVSTTMGAEGLGCVHNEHLLLADTPAEFAAAIERILTESDLAQRLRHNARALIERDYNWQTIGEQFVSLVEVVGKSSVQHVRQCVSAQHLQSTVPNHR